MRPAIVPLSAWSWWMVVRGGSALGLAALLTLAPTRTAALYDGAESAAEALVAGYRLAFLVAAGIASLGVVAALYFFRQAKDFDT